MAHRVGIIGLGTVGSRFVEQFNLHDAFDLISAWDIDHEACSSHRDFVRIASSPDELIAECDLVYVAEDAQIGYPVVRSMSPPDNQFFPHLMGLRRAMEMMLTGDAITGIQAVEYGFANRAYPAEGLESSVLEIAEKIAKVPADLQQMNKRAVHRQLELMGMRAAIRSGTEIQALAFHTESTRGHFKELAAGLTDALSKRDGQFGDYRTKK